MLALVLAAAVPTTVTPQHPFAKAAAEPGQWTAFGPVAAEHASHAQAFLALTTGEVMEPLAVANLREPDGP
jgi:hypothetical protein